MARRSGRRRGSPVRSLMRGLSARTVPMPVRIASASWRRRWTASRDCWLVIQVTLPAFCAIWPSRVSAVFKVTSGRPVRIQHREVFVVAAGYLLANAQTYFDSGAPKFGEAFAGNGGIGVTHGNDNAFHSSCDDCFRAWASAAGGATRFESDVESRAARFLSPPVSARRSRRGRDGRSRGSLRRRRDCPLTSTAPTKGFGWARATPRRANPSARDMCQSSRSSVEERVDVGLGIERDQVVDFFACADEADRQI